MVLLGSAAWATACLREGWRGRRVRHRTRGLLARAEHADTGESGSSSGRSVGRGDAGRGVGHLGRRVGRIRRKVRSKTGSTGGRGRSRGLRELGAALGVAAFAVVVVGGASGWLLGCAGGYGVVWWMRRRQAGEDDAGPGESAEARAAARAAAEQLPLAAELMGACLAAGSGPAQAADAVGRSLGGPLGALLIRTASELRLGAEPAAAWAHFASLPGGDGFVRSMERAGTAGAPAVEQVARLTGELRARRVREASARARRAAVLVTGPLGLCFLPAFLTIGVAPVVMGLAGSLL
ncbi:hypothetical protein HCC61_23245 [Streptomyces sp. HNM0575]|nr:hypothetical protein [Streptomyces sp. HNM0575]